MNPVTIIKESDITENNLNHRMFKSIIDELKIDSKYKKSYKDAFRFLLSSLDSLVDLMKKEDEVNITYEVTRNRTESSKVIPFNTDSLILISEKDIIDIIDIIDLPASTECYAMLLNDIANLPNEFKFSYQEELYKPTLLITALYLIFGHEATHSLISASHYEFPDNKLAEKQCDKSSCRLVSNLVSSIMLTFDINGLLPKIPPELFRGALVMNILHGVLIFCKHITNDTLPDSANYPPKTTRRIVSMVNAILALPLEKYYTHDKLCHVGVSMYCLLFEIDEDEAVNIFNTIAEENNYLL